MLPRAIPPRAPRHSPVRRLSAGVSCVGILLLAGCMTRADVIELMDHDADVQQSLQRHSGHDRVRAELSRSLDSLVRRLDEQQGQLAESVEQLRREVDATARAEVQLRVPAAVKGEVQVLAVELETLAQRVAEIESLRRRVEGVIDAFLTYVEASLDAETDRVSQSSLRLREIDAAVRDLNAALERVPQRAGQ